MKWFLGALLLLLAALALESGLLAFAMYVLLGLMLISRWLARGWMTGLSASRAVAHRRPKKTDETGEEEEEPDIPSARTRSSAPTTIQGEIGERVAVRVTLKNDSWLPVPWVLLEDMIPEKALD